MTTSPKAWTFKITVVRFSAFIDYPTQTARAALMEIVDTRTDGLAQHDKAAKRIVVPRRNLGRVLDGLMAAGHGYVDHEQRTLWGWSA